MSDDARLIRTPLRFRLSSGDRGTLETLWSMRAVVEDATRSPGVRARAAKLMARTPRETMLRVYNFVRRFVEFKPDPAGLELLRMPDDLLGTIDRDGTASVDCDESSCLVASLLRVIGLPAMFVVVGRNPSGDYEHVFTAAKDARGTIYPVDAQEGLGPIAPLQMSQWPRRLVFPLDLPVAAMARAGLAP